MCSIPCSAHSSFYFAPLVLHRSRLRMRCLQQVCCLYLLLLWTPQSIIFSSAVQSESNTEEVIARAYRELWTASRNGAEGDEYWQNISQHLDQDAGSGHPPGSLQTLPQRAGASFNAVPHPWMSDPSTADALHQQQSSVRAWDGGSDGFAHHRQGTITLPDASLSPVWATDPPESLLFRNQMSTNMGRSSIHRREEENKRRSSKTTQRKTRKREGAFQGHSGEPHGTRNTKTTRRSADRPRCKGTGDRKRNLLSNVSPLRHPHGADIGLQDLQREVDNELKVFDARKTYGLALLLSYLGYPAVSVGLSLAELGRVLLLATRKAPRYARWQHYAVAHTASAGERVVATYLNSEAEKAAENRNEQEDKKSVNEPQQRKQKTRHSEENQWGR